MRTREIHERTLAALLLTLVGALGLLGGILVDRTLLRPTGERAPRAATVQAEPGDRPVPRRQRRALDRRLGLPGDGDFLGWIEGHLELSDEQRRDLRTVVEQQRGELRSLTEGVRPRFREIVRETRRQVAEVLTPEQQRELRRILARRRQEGRVPPRR